MLPRKYEHYVRAFFIVLPMSFIVTEMNTVIALGPTAMFTVATMQRWAISALIAYPSVLLVTPLAIRIANALTRRR